MGLSLRGQTSGAIDINAPNVAGDNTITLPGTNGAANQFYKNSGTAGIITHSSMLESPSGNLGIGTDPGSRKVEIFGTVPTVLQLNSSSTDGTSIRILNSGTTKMYMGLAGDFIDGQGSNVTDSAIRASGACIFSTGGSGVERMRLDSSGRLGLGETTDMDGLFVIKGDSNGASIPSIRLKDGSDTRQAWITNASGDLILANGGDDDVPHCKLTMFDANILSFETVNTERMRIDSSGRLLVGTSSASSNDGVVVIQGYGGVSAGEGTIDLVRGNNVTATTQGLGSINFGHSQYQGASIDAESEAAWTEGSSHPSRLVFRTTANGTSSPTERLRITNQGIISVAQALSAVTPANGLNNGGIFIRPTTVLDNTPFVAEASSNAESVALLFANTNGVVGSIRVSGSATQYNESSDYRLKENIVDITDGITRLKQLKPRRFNFIADAATTFDGFIAHEAQAVIPEAVHGTKDEVDDKGQAIMQGIDKSKLVPLLTAALQEAITKIETLEAKVQALEES